MNFTPPLLRDYRKKVRDRRDGRDRASFGLVPSRGFFTEANYAKHAPEEDPTAIAVAQRHFLNRCQTLAVSLLAKRPQAGRSVDPWDRADRLPRFLRREEIADTV